MPARSEHRLGCRGSRLLLELTILLIASGAAEDAPAAALARNCSTLFAGFLCCVAPPPVTPVCPPAGATVSLPCFARAGVACDGQVGLRTLGQCSCSDLTSTSQISRPVPSNESAQEDPGVLCDGFFYNASGWVLFSFWPPDADRASVRRRRGGHGLCLRKGGRPPVQRGTGAVGFLRLFGP